MKNRRGSQVLLSGYECFFGQFASTSLLLFPPSSHPLYFINLFLTITNIFPGAFFLFSDTRHALKARIKDTRAHVAANKNKCSVHYLARELLISIHGSPLRARWKLFFIRQIYREICQYKPPLYFRAPCTSACDLREFPTPKKIE